MLAPLIAEALAVKNGILLALGSGLVPFQIETDSLQLVNILQLGKAPSNDVGNIICKILGLLESIHGWSICHVSRRGNIAAHSLAKLGRSSVSGCFWLNVCPPCVEKCILSDALPLCVKLPTVSFGSPAFLSLLAAKPPQQLSFPAAMLPSAATKLVAVPSKPYWSSGFRNLEKKRKENTMEEFEREFERALESFLNFIFGRNDDAGTGRRKTCSRKKGAGGGFEAGRRETGGGAEGSGSREAKKQDENDSKSHQQTMVEFLKDILRSMELTIKENKFGEVERVADYILSLIIGQHDAETGRRKGSRHVEIRINHPLGIGNVNHVQLIYDIRNKMKFLGDEVKFRSRASNQFTDSLVKLRSSKNRDFVDWGAFGYSVGRLSAFSVLLLLLLFRLVLGFSTPVVGRGSGLCCIVCAFVLCICLVVFLLFAWFWP
ncbi:hypothetical protein Ddye_018020 [Dipteronia dyeriana]|uniref:RNase H type-1 domain-containing protein n=1 Tax=Dipteronia dyeriana TaxID=168575 RepID=A0AAD9U9T3_9ROSI|nr:hypothetical protein Ddye_018020 [Dipteronia dyeriana]